jgi:SAM-dependent methyltransferase
MSLAPPHVLFTHNRDISQAAFVRAQALRTQIVTSVENRETYVAARHLDAAFCLPAANWGQGALNDFLRSYHHLRTGDYDVLNRLLFWSQFFSGYNQLWMAREFGRESVEPIAPGHDQWLIENKSRPDFWVKRWIKYKDAVSPNLLYAPPGMMGQQGWSIDGIIVNHDTYAIQERINILHEAGIIAWLSGLGRPPRILEIGGGYGALAFALRRIFPSAAYVICDLPESLMFSGLYLTLCEQDDTRMIVADEALTPHLSQPGVSLLPNYMLHRLLEQHASFDLVINTLSMSEMSAHQVGCYAAAIARLTGTSGVFFEQNQDNKAIGLIDCEDHIRDHFAHRTGVSPVLSDASQGRTNLWSVAPPSFLKPPYISRRRRLAKSITGTLRILLRHLRR